MTKERGAPKKRISAKEKEFVEYMISAECGPIESARKVFDWECEPGSLQARRALSISKAPRVKYYKAHRQKEVQNEIEATRLVADVSSIQ